MQNLHFALFYSRATRVALLEKLKKNKHFTRSIHFTLEISKKLLYQLPSRVMRLDPSEIRTLYSRPFCELICILQTKSHIWDLSP